MSTEYDITKKLILNAHLNIQDRKFLSLGSVRFSIVCEIIIELLDVHDWFPENFKPNMPFEGGLLEKLSNNKIKLYRKSEISIGCYKVSNEKIYSNSESAIRDYIKITYTNNIDGIPIDYKL